MPLILQLIPAAFRLTIQTHFPYGTFKTNETKKTIARPYMYRYFLQIKLKYDTKYPESYCLCVDPFICRRIAV